MYIIEWEYTTDYISVNLSAKVYMGLEMFFDKW